MIKWLYRLNEYRQDCFTRVAQVIAWRRRQVVAYIPQEGDAYPYNFRLRACRPILRRSWWRPWIWKVTIHYQQHLPKCSEDAPAE